MVTAFSAGPQALGYMYQARVALYLLLQSPETAVAKIESLDDIELIDLTAETKLTLVQLKHHVKNNASLTNASPDLWKSIRVWAEQAKDHNFALQEARLNLVTTSKAPSGSIASLLGVENRNAQLAEDLLIDVSNTSSNESLQLSFAAFKRLTPAERTSLVSSITILDQHENIDEYKAKIRKHIRPAVRHMHVDGLYQRLEGWWFDRVVEHLLNPIDTTNISAFELNEKIASIAEGFHEESLPIDFHNDLPDAAFIAGSQRKPFVRQLQAINAQPRVVQKAILDYYRAFNQRSRWLQEGLMFPDELTSYEKILGDEWERYFDSICGSSVERMTEEELIAKGHKLLAWAELEATHLKIRPRVVADFVRRGSFHILADKEPIPRVCWHPTYIQKLETVMASAAKSA
jgi:hypothetical protein